MAGKKENIKALFSNTRTRIIIVFTLFLVISTIVIGFVKFSNKYGDLNVKTDVSRSPGSIESIPGSLNQTEQYATLQNQQNVDQAAKAMEKGGSAIPTIIRSQAFGEGVEEIGPQGGTGSVGFSTLAQQNITGPQYSLWFQNVQDSNCSKASIDDAINNSGATISEIRKACGCDKLKDAGFSLIDLKPLCQCKKLRQIGYSIKEFKTAGYSAGELKQCGFTACEEHAVGFSAKDMKAAGYSDGELKGSGFSEQEIAEAGGIPEGVSINDIKKAGCSVEGLKKLKAMGVSAAAIRRINGCSAAQMKAAGFGAKELKDAGFSAAELKAAGFSPRDLRDAGFSARDLLNAGFTPDELRDAGFDEEEIKDAEAILPPGFDPNDIKNAGCTPAAIKRMRESGVSLKLIAKYAHCSAEQLKAGGFNDDDLARAGMLPKAVSKEEIVAAGCDVEKLKVLVAKGVTAKQIHDNNGCDLDTLKKLGFSADDLLAAGFTPEQLANAGIVKDKLDDEILKAGCSPEALKKLREKGVTAKKIREISGCSAQDLKAAGFSAKDLADAGFTPAELLSAGFTPDELKAAGMALSPAGIIAAGRTADCSVESLKAARAMGVSAATIKATLGCSAAAMKAAGFTAAELKDAGFTAAELKNAGFSAEDLKNAGFSAKDLRDAGFSAAELKAAGFSAKDLKNAGFSAAELKAAGFSAKDLKDAGFSAKDLKDAGFSAKDLKDAGFSAKELLKAGFSANQLKNAGFDNADLEEAGLSHKDSALAGLEEIDPTQKQPSNSTTIPSINNDAQTDKTAQLAENAKRIQDVMEKQKLMQLDQKLQQKIQQRTSAMISAANQIMQPWNLVNNQQYQAGNDTDDKDDKDAANRMSGLATMPQKLEKSTDTQQTVGTPIIKMGDIMFAVVDTAVNTDEPGPILATIVTGPFKGGKLIGSFNLPSNADKMVISFNTLTMPGAPKSMSISAFAIDPNTGRTALSSETDHHYLERYGSLFASTFLEGFGNAFQSADTTIQVGGTGGVTNTTVQNGIGRSALENAVIGLATVGKAWSQVAQQNMSRPTTVQIYSGTAIGVLFTQDLRTG